MLPTILISIATSGIFSLVVLLLVRQRLAGQFAEIFRRFGQMRGVLKTLDGVQKSLGVVQKDGVLVRSRVDRLSVAVARFQENTARRLAPLGSLAGEAARGGGRRELSERQLHQLVRHWSPAFALAAGEDDFRWLLRSLKRTEALWLDDVPGDAVDILARAAALMSLPRKRLRLADVGPTGGLLPLFLQRVLGPNFESVEITHLGTAELSGRFARTTCAPDEVFARAARMLGPNLGEARVVDSVEAFGNSAEARDALLIGAQRLTDLSAEARVALLAGVGPNGLVLVGGEDAMPEAASLAAWAEGLPEWEIVAGAWKTLVLRRRL